jgi:hypothetical protein
MHSKCGHSLHSFSKDGLVRAAMVQTIVAAAPHSKTPGAAALQSVAIDPWLNMLGHHILLLACCCARPTLLYMLGAGTLRALPTAAAACTAQALLLLTTDCLLSPAC